MFKRLSIEAYREGILAGDRFILSRAISLIESKRADDGKLAQELIAQILKYTGQSIRLGITGTPGVGKSTFIETFGNYVVGQGKKLAVLAIDPSSNRQGGSIMGDKTRMKSLSESEQVFIRPSPSGHALGGVARKTKETMLLCEAAGYDYIIVETVGVGQAEVAVKQLVDCFLLLVLAGAGDQLQGIKRGIMELADLIAVTKADEDNDPKIKEAQHNYKTALHYLRPHETGWRPPVLTCSALKNKNIDLVWKTIQQFILKSKQLNYFEKQRREQNLTWLKESVEREVLDTFYQHPGIKNLWAKIAEAVKSDQLSVYRGSQVLIQQFRK